MWRPSPQNAAETNPLEGFKKEEWWRNQMSEQSAIFCTVFDPALTTGYNTTYSTQLNT